MSAEGNLRPRRPPREYLGEGSVAEGGLDVT